MEVEAWQRTSNVVVQRCRRVILPSAMDFAAIDVLAPTMLPFLAGMAIIFNEAPELHPELPTHYPQCWDFGLSREEFRK